jgi:predicted ribosomally synthesized peptide with nif11-like leader
MSVETVKDFFEKVEENKDLQAKLKLLDKEAKDAIESAISKLVEIAKGEGFVFTAQDLLKARSEQFESRLDNAIAADKVSVPPPVCTNATAWRYHPPDPHGCAVAYGCGYEHSFYSGPHMPHKCNDDHAW